MWDKNDVIEITYFNDYTYHVTFDNGLHGDVDFSEYPQKGPVFAPLKEPGFFRSAFIEGGTIAWPNGADVAPESLYEKHPGNAMPQLRILTQKINSSYYSNGTTSRNLCQRFSTPGSAGVSPAFTV